MKHVDLTLFSPQKMPLPFDAIKKTDSEGGEWWNSRKLARGIEYVPEKTFWGTC